MGFLSSLLLSASLTFGSPVNHPLTLAGNFGEPRPNHFHAGIDVRTEHVEGKPIFSIADGYVSRITVGLHGFGNALYVTHPNGYTSVYCHLKRFIPQIAAITRKWQYANETWEADVRLKPTDFPVTKGQLIAVSGNTGASLAPHLHLELHETKSGSFADPLMFLSPFVKDTTPPVGHSIKVYPMSGEGVFNGSAGTQVLSLSSLPSRRNTAWGKIGFAIWANDYMEDSFGRLGVYRTTLMVDGREVFSSTVDSIHPRYNRNVNSWGDYWHFLMTKVWFMKSFAEPGNALPLLKTDADRGIITISEERPYDIRYILSDRFGNSREYSFTVHGERQDIRKAPLMLAPGERKFAYDRHNMIKSADIIIDIPRGLLPGDVVVKPVVRQHTTAKSKAYSFYPASYPLFNWADISMKPNGSIADASKLYIECDGAFPRFCGNEQADGWVKGRMRELGATYYIAYDDTPPRISAYNDGSRYVRIAMSDDKSGVKTWSAYVDDEFVLFEKLDKTSTVQCDIRELPVARTGSVHKLRFILIDNCGNESEYVGEISL